MSTRVRATMAPVRTRVERRVGPHRIAVTQRQRGFGRRAAITALAASVRPRPSTLRAARPAQPTGRLASTSASGVSRAIRWISNRQPCGELDVIRRIQCRPSRPRDHLHGGIQRRRPAWQSLRPSTVKRSGQLVGEIPLPTLKTRKLLSKMVVGEGCHRMHRPADHDRYSQSDPRDRRQAGESGKKGRVLMFGSGKPRLPVISRWPARCPSGTCGSRRPDDHRIERQRLSLALCPADPMVFHCGDQRRFDVRRQTGWRRDAARHRPNC